MQACLWFAAILLPTVVSSCSTSQIDQCNALQVTANTHPTPYNGFQSLGDPEFSQLCREGKQYRVCLSKFYSGCEKKLKSMLDAELDVLNYMCNDGKKTYLKYHQCFAGDDLNRKSKVCLGTFSAKISEVKSRYHLTFGILESEKNQVSDEVCRASDDLRSCIRQEVSKYCGDEAAQFIVELVSKDITPIFEAIGLGGCSATSVRHMKGVYIGVGVVVAILLGVVIGVIIIKARKRRPTGGDFNNPLQEAYTDNP